MIFVSDDENAVHISGVSYRAEQIQDEDSCEGCAFVNETAMFCSNIPCSPDKREDGTTYVIFVKQE